MEIKRARWLAKSFTRAWRRYPHVIGDLQAEVDSLALEVGDYYAALNEVWKRFSRVHRVKATYLEYTPDVVVKLYKSVRLPPDPRPSGPVANACFVVQADNATALSFAYAARRLGLEYDYVGEFVAWLIRVAGEPPGCSTPNRFTVGTNPASRPDLLVVRSRPPVQAAPYRVRAEYMAYLFAYNFTNVPVLEDRVPHSLFLSMPMPCEGETFKGAYVKLPPGVLKTYWGRYHYLDVPKDVGRDSTLIPSFSMRDFIVHWWQPRELTVCERLQILGFSFSEAQEIAATRLRNIPAVDLATSMAAMLAYLRQRGLVKEGGEDGDNNAA